MTARAVFVVTNFGIFLGYVWIEFVKWPAAEKAKTGRRAA